MSREDNVLMTEASATSGSSLRGCEIAGWCAIALALRLPGLADRLIDVGECYSYIRALGIYNPYPIFPPFYLLLRVWMNVFGETLLVMRIPSLLSSVLAVAFFARIAGCRLTRASTRFGILFLVLNPFDIYYSQYVRPYTFASSVTLLALCAIDRPLRARTIAVSLALGALAFLSHYSIFAAHVPLALALILPTTGTRGSRKWWRIGRAALLVLLGAAIIFNHARSILLPPEMTPRLLGLGFLEYFRLLPTRHGLGRVLEILVETIWAPFPLPGGNRPWKILLAGAFCLAAWGVARAWISDHRHRVATRAALLVLVGAPLIALYVQNGLGFATYCSSYTHSIVLAIAFLAAVAFQGLSAANRPVALGLAGVLLLGEIVGVHEIQTKLGRPNFPDWAAFEVVVRQRAQIGEVVLVGPESWYGVHHAWRTTGNPIPVLAYPDHLRLFRHLEQVTPGEFSAWKMRQLDPRDGLWIFWDRLDYLDNAGLLREELRTRWVETESTTLDSPPPGLDVVVSRLRRKVPGDSIGVPHHGSR